MSAKMSSRDKGRPSRNFYDVHFFGKNRVMVSGDYSPFHACNDHLVMRLAHECFIVPINQKKKSLVSCYIARSFR